MSEGSGQHSHRDVTAQLGARAHYTSPMLRAPTGATISWGNSLVPTGERYCGLNDSIPPDSTSRLVRLNGYLVQDQPEPATRLLKCRYSLVPRQAAQTQAINNRG